MVPIVDSFNHSINEALELLKRSIKQLNTPANLDGLLTVHFDLNSQLEHEIGWQVYSEPARWLQQNEDNLYQAPNLAVLGCLLAEQVRRFGGVDSQAANAFKTDLGRLQQRQNVFFQPNSWIFQPEVVMGIALGIKTVSDAALTHWMLALLEDGLHRLEIPLLPKLVYGYASTLLGGSFFHQQPELDLTVKPLKYSMPELALAIWLVKRGVLGIKDVTHWLEEAQAELLHRLVTDPPYEAEDYKAAIIWEVAVSYVKTRSRLPTQDLVSSLLENFEAAMERWKSKWTIEDEYDVQSLLWLILRSSFSDIRYEEYLPKLGRRGQRYDIGIPQLGLIVEAKFIRQAGDFQKIVDEIGKDSAQLQPQTTFTGIIVFVYDKSCSVEHHDWARKTLESIALVRQAIIVCAPSMCR